MIRFLRAFAWLRWRLLLNSIRGSKRRDSLEQISRMLALIVPAAIVVLSLGSVIVVSAAGFMAGQAVATARFSPPLVMFVMRIVLVVVLGLCVFLPLSPAAQTAAARYTRLLLLPIPRRALHFVEVLAGLADPWIAFILPGLALFALGALSGGRLDVAMVAAAAGAGLAAILVSISALLSSLVTWLLRDRRRGELFTLIFVFGISVVSVAPALFGSNFSNRRREDRAAGRPRQDVSIAEFEASLPTWVRVVPSEAYGAAIRAAVDRRTSVAWLLTGGLWLQALVLYAASAAVHRRLLESVEGSQGRRRRTAMVSSPIRLPGLSAGASAIAFAQVRTATRTVRGRLAILLPGPMLALLSVVLGRMPEEAVWLAMMGATGHLLFGGSLIFGIYALQAFTMNQLATDRAGLTLQFLSPVSDRELIWGKAAGLGLLFLLVMAVALLSSLAVSGGGPPALWVAVALGGMATFLLVAPVGALMSAVFPVPADLSKTGSGGNPHGASILVGTFLVLAATFPSSAIVTIGYHVSGSQSITLLAMFLWVVIALAVSLPLLSLVARVVTARRENLLLTLKS